MLSSRRAPSSSVRNFVQPVLLGSSPLNLYRFPCLWNDISSIPRSYSPIDSGLQDKIRHPEALSALADLATSGSEIVPAIALQPKVRPSRRMTTRKSCRLTLPSSFTSRTPVKSAPLRSEALDMFSVLELGVEDTPVSDALEVDSLVVSPLADDVSEEDASVNGAVDRFVEAESSAESLAAGCSVAGLPEESSLDGSPADALSAESSVSALLDADPLDDESSFESVSLGVSSSPEALAASFLIPVPVRRPATSDDRPAVSTCTRADFSPAAVGAN